ncbi:MAG: Na/Pi cotransporter family protein [Anderseniella sp.]|nr:Na/Pi cotransporter family protein [Anderseniella sp.]
MQLSVFLLNLTAAVVLLLYSTRMVRTGVERAFGAELRNVFMWSRRSTVLNSFAGILAAALLQSSTAVALLVSGFAATGVMGVTGSLAVVLGADLGTAVAVQFLSLDIAWLMPVLLVAGGLLFLKGSARVIKQIGRVVMGVAFILLSLRMIGDATEPLRSSPYLQPVVQHLSDDLLTAFAGGAALAFVFHSSVAAILMLAAFCAQGLLPLAAGLPLVLGANVGSGLIAVWLTRNMHGKARRIALGNLVVRVSGGIAALVLLRHVALPLDVVASTPARQLVGFHFLFNAALLVVFLPLVVPLAALTRHLVPADDEQAEVQARPVSALDRNVLNNPGLALASATRELLRMSEQIELMLSPIMELFVSTNAHAAQRIKKIEKEVNEAQTDIKLYLAEMNQGQLSPDQARRSMDLTGFAISLERVGDIITKDLLRLTGEMRKKKLTFSNEGWNELTRLHARVLANMQLSLNVLVSEDVDSARQLVEEKEYVRALEEESHDAHLARLGQGTAQSIATSDIHLETVRALKEINSRFITFAYPILKKSGLLLDSRLADIKS